MGQWSLSGMPIFDPVSGAFTGYRGGARRLCSSQRAPNLGGGGEGLRRLVHELRTPTNAIAGFSELIEAQLLGPVAPTYRERASAIHDLAIGLVTAIEDLDLAARIEGDALDLRPGSVVLAPLLGTIVADLQPLAARCGGSLVLAPMDASLAVACDDRALERLLSRLGATLVSAIEQGEAVVFSASRGPGGRAVVAAGRPRALAGMNAEQLLKMDATGLAEGPSAPLLGTGFALRLIGSLAAKLGGELTIGADRFTITLPLAAAATGQVATH